MRIIAVVLLLTFLASAQRDPVSDAAGRSDPESYEFKVYCASKLLEKKHDLEAALEDVNKKLDGLRAGKPVENFFAGCTIRPDLWTRLGRADRNVPQRLNKDDILPVCEPCTRSCNSHNLIPCRPCTGWCVQPRIASPPN